MPEDDDIIRAYEDELGSVASPRARSNRGFFLVTGTMLLIAIVVVVEIFVNKPLGDSISHAQYTLRQAWAHAQDARDAGGSFTAADAGGLSAIDDARTYVGPDEASTGLDVVSVSAAPAEWAAAVRIRPGACFYLHAEQGQDLRYGAGELCTARAALEASDSSW